MYQHVTRPVRPKPVILMRPTRLDLILSWLCIPAPALCVASMHGLSNHVLIELLKFTIFLPNHQTRTCYISRKQYTIIQKLYQCIVPLLTCLKYKFMSYVYVWVFLLRDHFGDRISATLAYPVTFAMLVIQGVTNSAIVIRVQMRGEGGSCGVSAN